ncbi:hypothetical protein ACVWZK_004768 [Bradyrhizobium sp. GM0.4]
MTPEISRLVISLLMISYGTRGFFGSKLPSMTRPAVVSIQRLEILPVSSMPSHRYLILVWRWMTFACSACSSSAISPKILPSPGRPSRMMET